MAEVALIVLRPWFAQPWLLLLPAVLPLLSVAALIAARWRRRALSQLGNLAALRPLVQESPRLSGMRRGCATTGLLLLTIGIAGPQWGRDYSQAATPGRDLVVVLDLSRSMLAETPSRLERAREALVELSHTVQQRGGHRLALVAFAGRPRIVCPLTPDYDHFREAVLRLEPGDPDLVPGRGAVSGTRIGAALLMAVEAHDIRYPGTQDILLLSDGDDPARDDEWRLGAEAARSAGIPVHVVGIGSPQATGVPGVEGATTRLEEGPLQEITRQTQGLYLATPERTPPLGDLFRERIEPRGSRDGTDDVLPLYRPRYVWFLAPALLFLGASVAIPERTRRPRTQG